MDNGTMKLWKVDDGERHIVVAETQESAIHQCACEDAHDLDWEITATAYDDDDLVTLGNEERTSSETKTAAQWVAENAQGGVLASTVF